MGVIALDTETTGLDLFHTSKPFFISTLNEGNIARCWEWPVDPHTREPKIKAKHLLELEQYLRGNDVVFHRATFDLRALSTIGVAFQFQDPNFLVPPLRGPTKITISCRQLHDTILMSHAMDSAGAGGRHGLKELALHYLDMPADDEKALHQATITARRRGKQLGWTLGVDLHGNSQVAYDYWMVKACYDHAHSLREDEIDYPPASWNTLLSAYAVRDVTRTLGLYFFSQEILRGKCLRANYERERNLIPVTYKMEHAGMHCHRKLIVSKQKEFLREEEQHRKHAEKLVREQVPSIKEINTRSGPQLVNYLTQVKQLPGKTTKNGNTSTDAEALRSLAQFLDEKEKLHPVATVIRDIIGYDPDRGDKVEKAIPGARGYATAASYLANYLGFLDDTDRVHPSFHQTGIRFTRYSSSDPNGQNVSVRSALPLRSVYGPPPGFVWSAIDYSQLELRLFAFLSQEKSLIEAFAAGHDFHMFVATKIFNLPADKITKTQRRIAKNTNFSLIYGGGEAKVDATAGMKGAYKAFSGQFPNVKRFMAKVIQGVLANGYVETATGYRLTIDPERAYSGVDGIVQGTAGDIMKMAMQDIHDKELVDWQPGGSAIIANIHDEAIFQFPLTYPFKSITRRIMQVMENAGKKLGVITPTDAKLIYTNWAKGIEFNGRKSA